MLHPCVTSSITTYDTHFDFDRLMISTRFSIQF